MNLDKQLLHVRDGKPFIKSFITEEDENAARNEKGFIDRNKIARETVGNVILNSLAFYPGETRKDGFYSNAIAQIVLGTEREVDLQNKFKLYLVKVLENTLIKYVKKEGKDEAQGLYTAWVIDQVLAELGMKFDDSTREATKESETPKEINI